jgi:signal-transduction protein with cAMP-binding, CBS, and nucleotidyltransferase domain
MKVSDFTWREPVTIDVGDTIAAAAQRFADAGVGSLVVVDDGRPVGIVTDRDLVVRALARGVASDGRVDGVMSMGVIALDADDDIEEMYAVFSGNAIRRVPVVEHDRVVGMVSLDDALVSSAIQMTTLAGVMSTQIAFPHARDEAAPPAVIDT